MKYLGQVNKVVIQIILWIQPKFLAYKINANGPISVKFNMVAHFINDKKRIMLVFAECLLVDIVSVRC